MPRLFALMGLGVIAQSQGDSDTALEHFKETLALAQQLDNRVTASLALNNMGVVARTRGYRAEAREYLEQSLSIARNTGALHTVAVVLSNLGLVTTWHGRIAEAQAYLLEGLTHACRRRFTETVVAIVANAGYLLVEQGQRERGMALLGLSRQHPAADVSLKADIAWILRTLDLDPADPDVSSQLEGGASLELDIVVATLLEELKPSRELRRGAPS